jgi:hypothetical protein
MRPWRRIKNRSGSDKVSVIDTATNTGAIETHEIHYQGGNRYPHLERVDGTADYLGDILKPLTPARSY